MATQPLVNSLAVTILALAVFLSGIHSKDLIVPVAQNVEGLKKADDTHHKISAELHHHNESSLKVQHTSDGHQADTRSLRLLHHRKTAQGHRLNNRLWQWWRQSSLNLT